MLSYPKKTFNITHCLFLVQGDYQLYLDIRDEDFGPDDDIDEIIICTSLFASSNFTTEIEFSGDRVTLTLRFRVQCTNGYEGPRCDCLPQDNDVNGHYRCEEDGSISCLLGYTDPSSFCRQGKCMYKQNTHEEKPI